MKTTLRDIREFANSWGVTDITYLGCDELNSLRSEEGGFDTVSYSQGTYGMTGAIVRGFRTGKLYAITSRTNAIYICM